MKNHQELTYEQTEKIDRIVLRTIKKHAQVAAVEIQQQLKSMSARVQLLKEVEKSFGIDIHVSIKNSNGSTYHSTGFEPRWKIGKKGGLLKG